MRLPPLTLVLGGTASGKSAFGERMLLQSGLAKVYIAADGILDEQTATTAALHRARRMDQGWRTVASIDDTATALARIEAGEAALVDSVSGWLASILIDEGDWEEEFEVLLDVLIPMRAPVVLISTDASGAIVPDDTFASTFQRALGQLNQELAQHADLVVLITAGLPQVLKGQPQTDPVDEDF